VQFAASQLRISEPHAPFALLSAAALISWRRRRRWRSALTLRGAAGEVRRVAAHQVAGPRPGLPRPSEGLGRRLRTPLQPEDGEMGATQLRLDRIKERLEVAGFGDPPYAFTSEKHRVWCLYDRGGSIVWVRISSNVGGSRSSGRSRNQARRSSSRDPVGATFVRCPTFPALGDTLRERTLTPT